MRFKLYLAVLLISLSSASWSDEKPSVSATELLASAKLSGACGIIVQMADFQQSTKMAGGTEFLYRFTNTEAARLGWTVDQYLEHCRTAHKVYQTYYDALEQGEKHLD